MASAAGNRAPGLHTPTQSFSGSPADTLTPGVAFDPMARTDKKKLKEEVDGAKQRLTDVKFNMRKSPNAAHSRTIADVETLLQGIIRILCCHEMFPLSVTFRRASRRMMRRLCLILLR